MKSKGSTTPGRAGARLAPAFAACLLVLAALASPALAAKTVVRTLGSADASGSPGLFNAPRGVAVNRSGAGGVAAGALYAVDSGNHRVERFSPTGDFEGAFGTAQLGEGARGIAVDQSSGDVYVSDQSFESRRIDIFTAGGSFVGAFGWGVRNEAEELQFCTAITGCAFPAGGEGEQGGKFSTAIGGLAIAGNGDAYVANSAFNRIDVFRPQRTDGVVTSVEFLRSLGWEVTIGGNAELEACTVAAECKAGLAGAGAGQFSGSEASPSDLAFDGEGNLFALDPGNDRVQRLDPAAPAVLDPDFGAAALDSVFGTGALQRVATSPQGHLFVAGSRDGSEEHVAVAELDQAGDLVETQGTDLTVTGADGLAAAGNSFGGNLYLASGEANRVFVLNEAPAMKPVTVFGGTTATFEGEVAAGGFPTEYHFEYSTDGQGWTRVPTPDAPVNVPPPAEVTPTGASIGTLTIAATGGTFTLAFGGETTEPIAFDAPAGTVEAALEALPAIGAGNVTASGGPGSPSGSTPYEIEFTGALAGVEVWEIIPDGSSLATPPIPVSQEVSGLTGSQLYHVRLVQNRPTAGGSATSGEVTFTTAAAAPAIRGAVASLVSSGSATLNASLNPQNQDTSYRFEYGTSPCSGGGCASLPTASASGGGFRQVSQGVTGLQPATVYRFRLVAENGSGTTPGPEGTFTTLAIGASLPDGRGYELVSPPDTAGVVPSAAGLGESEGRDCFITSTAAPSGESVIFQSLGGAFPGVDGNGTFDSYRAIRTSAGWTSGLVTPNGSESEFPSAGGCFSEDHSYATFRTGSSPADNGSLVLGGSFSSYLIGPEGTELAGQGALGTDQDANVRWISPGGDHVVFTSSRQLEPTAPESVGPGEEAVSGLKTTAVYDRRPSGQTEVASLLPSGEAPDPSTETTYYQGSSADGSAIVFKVEEAFEGQTTIYERIDETETLPVASAPAVGSAIYAGVSEGGSHVFYVEPDLPGIGSLRGRGRLFDYDAGTEVAQAITPGGNAHFVNISADGSHAYFVSPEILDGSEGEEGGANLYLWSGGTVKFIAVLDEEDASGDVSLARWTETVASAEQTPFQGFASDPSRTTPDGQFLVFESRAPLTGYDSGGHAEIFRYAAADGSIVCISCNPSEAPAGFDSRLETTLEAGSQVRAPVRIANITDDGQMVFFGTREGLLPDDVNSAADVYEWHAGRGISLISAGDGSRSFLYGMSPDGRDVFFTTKDALVPADTGAIDSIYDARVGGGFPPPQAPPPPCRADACQATVPPPSLGNPATEAARGGNHKARACPKGRKKVRRHGKTRCVKRHAKRHHRGKRGAHKGGKR